MGPDFTEDTLDYWQHLTLAPPETIRTAPPFRRGYPVRLSGGAVLVLPLRMLPDRRHAVASLIANQASFSVVAALSDIMADRARSLPADLIVGLPTLGLSFAARVAERLGHTRYAPLGYSRKFWYDEALSEPVTSITSPEPGKALRLDPNLSALIRQRRVLIVDDAISSGATAAAAYRLLQRSGADIAGIVVAMKQDARWTARLAELLPAARVLAAFECPIFERSDEGWMPVTDRDATP